jgi:hypothetical protein
MSITCWANSALIGGKLALWRHGQSAISYRPVAGDDLTIAVPASSEGGGGLAL